MDNQGNHKIRELLICLTDNASSPRMLWQMVSSSALAKDTFETWPRGRLLSAIKGLSPEIQQLAAEYAFLTLTGHRRQGTQNNLEDDVSLLPEVILEPLHALKALASVDEAIEALSSFEIWKVSNILATNTESKSNIHRIKVALWRFAVLGALDSNDDTDTGTIKGSIQYDEHFVYLWDLNEMALTDMARVYDDLSYMIQLAYPEKLATAFAHAYCYHDIFEDIDWRYPDWRNIDWSSSGFPKQWHEQAIMIEAESRINSFVDGQMARGLPFLCSLHRGVIAGLCPSSATISDYHCFPDAFAHIMVLNWGYQPNNYHSGAGSYKAKHKAAYHLTPTKDKYRVSLLFGSRSTYFLQRFMHIDEKIILQHQNDTFYSGEEHWEECMVELYGTDLEDSLWIFEEYEHTDVVDLLESSWMFDEG